MSGKTRLAGRYELQIVENNQAVRKGAQPEARPGASRASPRHSARRFFGERHPNTATSLNNIAIYARNTPRATREQKPWS